MSKRIEYIDIARGIGILLVVLGHNDFSLVSPFGYRLIYSFHMPLFFFLSGYFFNPSPAFFDFIRKRFNSLLKPYLFTIFLIYFVSVSFGKMSFSTAIGRIVKSLYASGYYIDWVQLWFLPHLFAVSLYAFFFLFAAGKLKNKYVKWGILAGTLGIAVIFLKEFYPYPFALSGKSYTLYGLPFSLDLVLLSGFFFISGSEVKKNIPGGFFDSLLLFVATGVAMLAFNFLFESPIDFNTRTYASFIINTLEAFAGILFVLSLSRQIELRTIKTAFFFKYFGQISLIILLFHVPIQDFWGQKVLTVTNNVPLSIGAGFVMGVAGSALIYELLFKANPVASFWIGRDAKPSA